MATVTTLAGGASAGRTAGSVPYLVDVSVDFAAAATAKGSALAAADIIEAINVPANTVVLTAGMEVTTALAGESADTRLLLGVTGGDVDAFVDGMTITGASAGDYATLANTATPILVTTSDTIDMLLLGTTPDTSGKVRVYACLMDVDSVGSSKEADEVDRDLLA